MTAMCGIVGYFDRSGEAGAPVGRTLLRMLAALGCRGPDSSGVALWGKPADGLVARVKMGEGGDADARRREIVRRAARLGRVSAGTVQGSLLRLVVAKAEPGELAAAIEAIAPDVEVVSMGRRLEIVKQVGAPANLEAEFGVSRWTGTHALGHTRLSTESRVDLSHSQPFWAHGTADLAIVHNGHITNYHKLRRVYEQAGVRFYTENDSEIIGVYLAMRLREGLSFREALEASLRDLDGSFSYLAATSEAFGFAKDPFCLKPLIVGESDGAVAVANEEIAIHTALPGGYQAREAGARAVGVWEVAAARPARDPARRARRAVA
ncbi:MAG: glutamine phosphoribosylpyrophosphate amidotransferase [Candidatus Rokubacteria bacterium]|nr:glutamine phosphoribosylpyrophosphate amidotransferase [Candidatus Rokubacteria bacterium]